jgi:peptidoglycan/xylan/chitin deacetylase (PgdA/CDA1 family)
MSVIYNDLCPIGYEKYEMGDEIMSLNTTKYYFTIVIVILSILFVVPSAIKTYESGNINKIPDNHVIPDNYVIPNLTAHNALMLIPQSDDNYKNAHSGLQIDDFENSRVWETDNASMESETILYQEGTQSIRVTPLNIEGSITKGISLNFSEGDGFTLWINVPDTKSINLISLYFTSENEKFNSNFNKYFIASLGSFRLSEGWNKFKLLKSAFVSHGGEDWNNTMSQVRIKVENSPDANSSVLLDELMFNENGRARVLISFDDGWDSVYTIAYPVLTRNNQKATVFVITGSVGNSKNYMNLSELATLYNSGWDVSSHSVNHTDMTKIPEQEMRTEINDSYDWLVDHGFTTSAKFFAYPYGAHNNRTIKALKEKGYVLSRTLEDSEMSDSFKVYQGDSLQLLRTIELKNITTDEQIRQDIDFAITTNSTIIFTVHKIVDSDADNKTKLLLSTFETMSDYLSLKKAQIDVVTFGEYWNAISSNPMPKPKAAKKTETKQVNAFASFRDLRTLIDTTIAEQPSKCERIRLLHYLIPTNNATFDSYVNSVITRTANNYDYTSPDELWNTCVKNRYDMGDHGVIKTFVIDNRTVIMTQ